MEQAKPIARRRHDVQLKERVVAACAQLGASVARIAIISTRFASACSSPGGKFPESAGAPRQNLSLQGAPPPQRYRPIAPPSRSTTSLRMTSGPSTIIQEHMLSRVGTRSSVFGRVAVTTYQPS
jgi:hypothetical protein